MDWLRSEDLKEEKDVTAPTFIVAGTNPNREPDTVAMLALGYTDAFRSLHVGEGGHFTFWGLLSTTFQKQSRHTNRSFLTVFRASNSTRRLRDR